MPLTKATTMPKTSTLPKNSGVTPQPTTLRSRATPPLGSSVSKKSPRLSPFWISETSTPEASRSAKKSWPPRQALQAGPLKGSRSTFKDLHRPITSYPPLLPCRSPRSQRLSRFVHFPDPTEGRPTRGARAGPGAKGTRCRACRACDPDECQGRGQQEQAAPTPPQSHGSRALGCTCMPLTALRAPRAEAADDTVHAPLGSQFSVCTHGNTLERLAFGCLWHVRRLVPTHRAPWQRRSAPAAWTRCPPRGR